MTVNKQDRESESVTAKEEESSQPVTAYLEFPGNVGGDGFELDVGEAGVRGVHEVAVQGGLHHSEQELELCVVAPPQ